MTVHYALCIVHSAQRLARLGAAVLLLLCLGCATPDRYDDDRTPDPVGQTDAGGAFGFLMEIVYVLGCWLGPKT